MPLRRRSALLVLLLLALFAVSGLLAFEAWSAGVKRRALADQAMRQYASYAAAKYRDNVQAWLYTALDALFANVWVRLEETRGGAGAGAAALARSARAFEACRCGPAVHGEYYFEVPLAGGGARGDVFTIPGSRTPAAAERHWLADTVAQHARWWIAHRAALARRFGSLAVLHDYETIYGLHDTGTGRIPVVIYTLRRDARGAPRSAIGLVTDADRFVRSFFAPLYTDRIVLPLLLTGWVPNDSLLSVMVGDSLGRILFRSRVQYASALGDTVDLDPPLGLLRITFLVRPSVEKSIVAGGLQPSRVPMLLVALVAAALLTVLTMLQVRAELRLARQRSNFAASVSHELRTPLAQILLFAETVRLGRSPSEQRRGEALDVIIREAHRLMTLVDNVLHVTRAERGLTRVSLEWIVVRHVLCETVAEFAPLTAESGSRVTLEPVDARILANADAGTVRQMLLNVLDNAAKYGPPGQVIRVGAAYHRDTTLIWVDDEGPGVRVPDRDRIWKPFVRLNDASARDVPGAGIGLAVVRELVAAQRGRAWVELGTRGGARFVIALPGAIADEDADASVTGVAARGDA